MKQTLKQAHWPTRANWRPGLLRRMALIRMPPRQPLHQKQTLEQMQAQAPIRPALPQLQEGMSYFAP